MTLSTRGIHSKTFPNVLFEWAVAVVKNGYDKDINPDGMLNLGFAESSLCDDIIVKKMNENGSNQFEPWMVHYFDFRGTASFRDSLAAFMTTRFNSVNPVDPENLILTSGVGAAIDILMHAFADPGDYILTTSPLYFAVRPDMGIRGQVKTFNIQLPGRTCPEGEKTFSITRKLLEDGMREAKEKGANVRAIFIVNPNNPTGDIYTAEEIKIILDFAHNHDIHVIMDEIYGMTIFDDNAKFHSILAMEDVPCPEKTHMLWGFSKDFCIAGLRCGVIHTWNQDLLPSVAHLLYMGAVPTMVQHKLKNIIDDTDWLDTVYFPTNKKRLQEAYQFCRKGLEAMGVKVHPGKATYFLWADMSHLMRNVTKEAEMELFKELYFDAMVYCLPGQFLCYDEPGWFRFTVTNSMEYVQTGLDRLEKVLQKMKTNS